MKLIFKSLWPELRVYTKQLILVFVLGIVMSALKGISPELLGRLPAAWEHQDYAESIRIPLIISASWIAACVARYYHLFWMVYLSDLVAVNLRRRLMNKYLSLNLGFFQNFIRGSGGLLSRMINDINIIQGGTSKLADIVREPFMVLFTFGYLVWLDWRLVVFLVAGMPIVTGRDSPLCSIASRKYARHNQESMEDLTQTIKESLDGTRIVQSFNLQEEMRRRFEEQAENYLSSRRKIISREEASGPVSESMAALFIAAVLIYIGNRAIHGQFSLGNFLSFSFALGLLQDSTRKVQDAFIRLQQSAVALERLNSILNDGSVVPEIDNAQILSARLERNRISKRHFSLRSQYRS